MTPIKTLEKSPPSLKPDLFGGHFLSFRRRPLEFSARLARLGDVAYFRLGNSPAYLVSHPDLVREVFVTQHSKFHKGFGLQKMKPFLGEGLLTSENEFHLRQRRMIQPAFHRQRIAGYAATMIDFAEKCADAWRDGETREMSDEMTRLTLNIVNQTLFSANVESDAQVIAESVDQMLAGFGLLLLPFSDIIRKLPIPRIRRYHEAHDKIDRIIYRIINERRESGATDNGDLLSTLLLAQDEDDGATMTDEQVRDEVLTLFLAGHETTANALVWTWYLLAQNPNAEAEFHCEIDRVLSDKRLPTFEDYPNLRYAEAVFAEAMRLYPPAWLVGRTAIEAVEIGGYKMPKGALVFASPFALHRDERFWHDAETFKPERWLDETNIKEATQNFTYFPFGGGVRRCVGESFAWTEGVLLLATIARKWRLKFAPNQNVELSPVVVLRPKNEMRMTIERR